MPLIRPLLLLILLSSCGVNHHLRKAEKHLKKAEQLGAVVKADTLWKTLEIPVPVIELDTVLRADHFRDTITVQNDKVVTKLKYDTITRLLYVSTECTPDTIKVKVPVIVNKEIRTPRGFWYYAQWIGAALIIGFVLGAVFWASLRVWLKSFL
jgi:hypothetical protein